VHYITETQIHSKNVFQFGARHANDNQCYTEIAHPGIVEVDDGFLVIFAAENNPPLSADKSKFATAPRDLALVKLTRGGWETVEDYFGDEELDETLATGIFPTENKVRAACLEDSSCKGFVENKEGFQLLVKGSGACSPKSDEAVVRCMAKKTVPKETGSRTNYAGNLVNQINEGVRWVTNHGSRSTENAARLKVFPIASDRLLLVNEIWSLSAYVRTEVREFDVHGNVVRGPWKVCHPLRNAITDDGTVIDGNAVMYTASGQTLQRFEIRVKAREQKNYGSRQSSDGSQSNNGSDDSQLVSGSNNGSDDSQLDVSGGVTNCWSQSAAAAFGLAPLLLGFFD